MAGDADKRSFVVGPSESGERIDVYLSNLQSLELTRSKLQKLIADGLVTVDGASISKNHRVSDGEIIDVTIVASAQPHVEAEDIPLAVVYHDEHLAVIDKPAGMVTHPAIGHHSGTLVNAIMHRFGLSDASGEQRPGIVHRLDKDTSGLILVALNERIQAKLQKMIKDREVHRSYTALIWGHMPQDRGEIEAPIGRSTRDRKKMAVTDLRSREARTGYHLLERYSSFDLLELQLHTGRTHQIRVHLAHVGHPVFGDPDYGGRDRALRGMFAPERPLARKMLDAISRQALHASKLELVHPVTEEELQFISDLPPDFLAVLSLARGATRHS